MTDEELEAFGRRLGYNIDVHGEARKLIVPVYQAYKRFVLQMRIVIERISVQRAVPTYEWYFRNELRKAEEALANYEARILLGTK